MSKLQRTSFLLSNLTDADELLTLAQQCAQTGFSRVWLAETGGLETSALAGVIARTTPLEVGTSIVPVYTRTPALLSMMASTWSHLGSGRPVHLGIGAGGQVIVEKWHGLPFDKPVGTTRDTISIVRQALSGEKTDVTGKTRTSTGFKLATGAAPQVKIYVGGMGPAMVDLAAEVADGLIVTWLSPRVLSDFRTSFSKAAVSHGRSAEDLSLVARAYVAVTPTPAEAREAVRKEMVEYVVSPPYGRYFASVGFEEEVTEVQAAFKRRDRQGAISGISDRLLDEVLVVGSTADEVRERLTAYLDAGADELMVQPVPSFRGGDPAMTISAVADAMR